MVAVAEVSAVVDAVAVADAAKTRRTEGEGVGAGARSNNAGGVFLRAFDEPAPENLFTVRKKGVVRLTRGSSQRVLNGAICIGRLHSFSFSSSAGTSSTAGGSMRPRTHGIRSLPK